MFIFFFQAEDGIRDLVRSRGLGDVYKRQFQSSDNGASWAELNDGLSNLNIPSMALNSDGYIFCLLYTSDAADERSSVDLGGRRIIKKKTENQYGWQRQHTKK